MRVWVDFPGWTKLILGEPAAVGLPKVKIYGEFLFLPYSLVAQHSLFADKILLSND